MRRSLAPVMVALTALAACGQTPETNESLILITDQSKPTSAPGLSPPEATPSCFTGYLGGESSCKPSDVWGAYVQAECGGLNVNATSMSRPCDGGFQGVRFQCCKKKPDPASAVVVDPAGCETALVVLKECASAEVLDKHVADRCGERQIKEILYGPSCGKKQFRAAGYTCCD